MYVRIHASCIGVTGFFVREIARECGVPIQEFAVRNDCPCGSTIGPIISANTGMRQCILIYAPRI